MTTSVKTVTLVQSADGTTKTEKAAKKKKSKAASTGCKCNCKCNSVWTADQARNANAGSQSRRTAQTTYRSSYSSSSSSGGCGFWGKLGNGLKALACGAGKLLAGGVKAFGGLLGLGGKMIGGLGATLGSSNLGFGLGAGLGAYGLYSAATGNGLFGCGGYGFGGWPFMTTSGFYRPLCSGVGGMCGGWRAPAFVAGGFPNVLSCNGFGSANLLGFDFGAFGNRPILGAHASQNPLQHYWSCGAGGKSVFGFN